jgi:hypothetical protein
MQTQLNQLQAAVDVLQSLQNVNETVTMDETKVKMLTSDRLELSVLDAKDFGERRAAPWYI